MFKVIWSNAVLDELADIYVNATVEERARMAAGVAALNARLASDPLDEGESRSGEGRITFPGLLAVGFRVDERARIVRVTRVRRSGK